MELPTEQFKAVQELAEVNVAIASGRAALTKLKDDTKSYLEFREVAAHKQVEKVLEESIEALESIKNNHAELSTYASEIRALALELHGFSEEIVALFSDFQNVVAESNAKLDIRLADLKAREKEVMIEKEGIKADRRKLDGDMANLRDEKRLLADRQEVVRKTTEAIKKITGKNTL